MGPVSDPPPATPRLRGMRRTAIRSGRGKPIRCPEWSCSPPGHSTPSSPARRLRPYCRCPGSSWSPSWEPEASRRWWVAWNALRHDPTAPTAIPSTTASVDASSLPTANGPRVSKPPCPPDMAYVKEEGAFPAICMDRNEVTLGKYRECDSAACTIPTRERVQLCGQSQRERQPARELRDPCERARLLPLPRQASSYCA